MVTRVRFGIVSTLLLTLVIALVAPLVIASDGALQGKIAVINLDPAKTTIAYSLDGWPHHTEGTFALKRGAIRVDPLTGRMGGLIIVDAASGNSGHSVRDERMKSSVLEVSRYPDISFAPLQVLSHGNVQGEFPVAVRGLMSLHGSQHDFTINARVLRAGNLVTIHCRFAIPFVEWGLTDPSILMFKVAKEVDINVATVGQLSWEK
jgi:polyisoprenoid-binding protein YceI